METVKIYEGAVRAIQSVMNVVYPVVEVYAPSLLLLIKGMTLAFRLTLMGSWHGTYFL